MWRLVSPSLKPSGRKYRWTGLTASRNYWPRRASCCLARGLLRPVRTYRSSSAGPARNGTPPGACRTSRMQDTTAVKKRFRRSSRSPMSNISAPKATGEPTTAKRSSRRSLQSRAARSTFRRGDTGSPGSSRSPRAELCCAARVSARRFWCFPSR